MTMDKSLQVAAGKSGVRSVLKRGERIAKLQEGEKWVGGQSPLGLPKVRVYKLSMKKKKKTKEEGEAATPAKGGKAAPAAKAAATKAAPAKKK